jgi:hypothetical protein
MLPIGLRAPWPSRPGSVAPAFIGVLLRSRLCLDLLRQSELKEGGQRVSRLYYDVYRLLAAAIGEETIADSGGEKSTQHPCLHRMPMSRPAEMPIDC